ncbi:MAG TPA: circularly permuted type 2 ATP-grasp protein, partial [Sporichthya sp.]|nr:circularly permuted type 2 ATP-grasp protein [Sporichthya sp.]
LSEEPILANVDTYRLDEPETLKWVLAHLKELVLKPVDASGGKGIVIGPRAEPHILDEMAVKVAADPRGWIAQQVVQLSTVPTLIDGQLRPRHVDLRPFALNDGKDVYVLPGGLTRVALPEGQLIVNSSQGGGSKDTWVLAGPDADEPTNVKELPEEVEDTGIMRAIRGAVSTAGPRHLGAIPALHRQAAQQQQGRTPC